MATKTEVTQPICSHAAGFFSDFISNNAKDNCCCKCLRHWWEWMDNCNYYRSTTIHPFFASESGLFSNGRIAAVCASTASTGQPIVDTQYISMLDTFRAAITADDAAASLGCTACKHTVVSTMVHHSMGIIASWLQSFLHCQSTSLESTTHVLLAHGLCWDFKRHLKTSLYGGVLCRMDVQSNCNFHSLSTVFQILHCCCPVL